MVVFMVWLSNGFFMNRKLVMQEKFLGLLLYKLEIHAIMYHVGDRCISVRNDLPGSNRIMTDK